MKKILLTLNLCLLAATALVAQDKIKETSGKKPAWAKDLLASGYVITQGDGATLNAAQQEALLMAKQEIVRSVAEQIITTSTRSLQEQNMQITEAYTQNITSKASKVPYLQGISVSQIEESYWEKIQDKKSKAIFYRYYIKYPFNKAQLSKLVAEFKEEDNKITQRINELEAALTKVESVEQIDASIEELGGLLAGLEDNRKEKSALLQSRYRALYESILIAEVENVLGSITYKLMLGNRTIQSTRKPQVKSECAAIAQVNIGATCTITYRYDGCYDDVENYVNVLYRFGSKNVSHKFLIPLK